MNWAGILFAIKFTSLAENFLDYEIDRNYFFHTYIKVFYLIKAENNICQWFAVSVSSILYSFDEMNPSSYVFLEISCEKWGIYQLNLTFFTVNLCIS